MFTKKQMCIDFLNKENILICPYCNESLKLHNNMLICNNNHNFDVNKKGNLFLVNTANYKSSKIYDTSLFKSRREFISKNYYRAVYDYISKFINSCDLKDFKILDLGCGEGSHVRKIQEKLNNNHLVYGLDYSKDAINMATDYLQKGNFYFVADINNIPLKSNSIDVIIDFLSPYNSLQITRILKNNGYFIKVVPGNNYLIELRNAFLLDNYEKKDEIKINIEKSFDILSEHEINEKQLITEDDLNNLISMTPIHNKKIKNNRAVTEITINLIIYVMRKR